MNVQGGWPIFAVGCVGGLLAEFAGIWALRKEAVWPAYLRLARYWVISGIMVLLCGGLAVVYGMSQMPIFLALNIGASAPLMIQRFSQTIAPPPTVTVPPDARIG